jgi:hypothetical protein
VDRFAVVPFHLIIERNVFCDEKRAPKEEPLAARSATLQSRNGFNSSKRGMRRQQHFFMRACLALLQFSENVFGRAFT